MQSPDLNGKNKESQAALRAINVLDNLELATIDELTDIPNARGFNMLAKNALGICARQDIPATLLYFDLNDFQPINDRWGQDEGNKALLVFAEALKSSFRCSDPLGRLAGDQFAVLLTGTGIEMARLVVEKFGEAFSIYNQKAGLEYDLCFNSGIAQYQPEQHPSVETLLEDAGNDLHQLRSRGTEAIGQRLS